ncbi:DUF2877 domain-containing protein [Photobacterium sp. MCCC 1A19761]|uniref:oxamate carbamoyltransferase subunit AllH family protein n=1 Tax=Photobacterium sp. MCCC 1A19761 TaxID=3115000 RepID=UPI00307DEF39
MKVIQVAEPILALLRIHSPLSTEVHSVFTSACNLASPYGLISVLAPTKRMNPRGILIDDPAWFRTLQPGATVSLSLSPEPTIAQSARSPGLSIHGPATTVFSPKLPETTAIPAALISELPQYLAEHQTAMGIYTLLNHCVPLQLCASDTPYYSPMMADFFMPRLRALVQALHQQRRPLDLSAIIGFGAGLTPSADDLLVGLLSLLDFINHPYFSVIAQACRLSLAQTTDVSATMLSLATEHQYNEEIIALYAVLSEPDQLPGALDNMLAYGHSSGHDTLCGIFVGIHLFAAADSSGR